MSIDPTFLALLGDFVEETLPMAENVGTAMLGLERSWKEGQNDPALLQSMKSDLHTIKGNSAMMGLTPIQSLSHALEDVCALFSEAPSARSATTAQLFLDGTDLLASMIRTSMEGEVDAAASARLVERIARYVKGEDAAQPKAQAERPLPTEAAAPAAVAGDGPSPAPEPPAESTAARAQPHKTPSSDSPKREDHELRPEGEAHAQEPTAAGRGRSGIESVRIDSRRLDELLELTAELVITHSSLSRIHRRLLVANGATDDVQELDLSILSLSKIVKQLQESLMVARLLPVSMLFGKFSRYVRDLGREKGQPIKLVTAGGETPIDKTLID
ncbi:MAG: Hpt domain-containing protein, partial [Deltaproteobacteria bacterium]|nr:Hpt domain-containing protein [Deltaproteobacteria bacterium]